MRTRGEAARLIRLEAAELAARPLPRQAPNGDERRCRHGNGSLSYAAAFTKGLPHDADGLVEGAAYRSLLRALEAGRPDSFADVPHGVVADGARPFLDPLAGLAFELLGADPQSFALAPAPALDSAEAAAELAELQAMALLRDVPFAAFAAGQKQVEAAVAQLNGFYAFSGTQPIGPGRVRAQAAPETLFRGVLAGDREGPYLSQLLWPRAEGQAADGRLRPPPRGVDHGTDWAAWLGIQNGEAVTSSARAERIRLIVTPRDLAAYTAAPDAVLRICLGAADVLRSLGALDGGRAAGTAARIEDRALHGPMQLHALLVGAAVRAERAASFQKWYVHRRLRPEAMAGRVELNRRIARGESKAAPLDIHEGLAASGVLDAVARHRPAGGEGEEQGTWLLPLARPDGSPMAPSYGGGHAAAAGACVTILKAWCDESLKWPSLLEPDTAGRKLLRRTNAAGLTAGGELNKLASNLAIGRCLAGDNYFSDCTEGLWLGENVAVALLREYRLAQSGSGRLTLMPFFGGEPVAI